MKIEKINTIDNILEGVEIIQSNFKNLSKSGDFIGALLAAGFKNDELQNQKLTFNKTLHEILEKVNQLENFMKVLSTFTKHVVEEENRKIKETKPNNKMLDLRSHEDLGIDEATYNITIDNGSSWFSKIEID